MRAVIVFDNSGSMRQNDPQRLSRVAARLFLDLAQPHDHIGLVAFSETAIPLTPLLSMHAPTAKQTLLDRLRSLQFDGQTTDLGVALQAGASQLSR